MRRNLFVGGLLVATTAAVVGGGAAGQRFLSPTTWHILWTSLVAFAFLVLAGLAVWSGSRRWILPFAVGCVVQTIGVVLYAVEEFDSPWETVGWTLLAVTLVLAGMGVYFAYIWWRARRSEEALLNPELEEEGVDPEELKKIRDNMANALDRLRRAGLGRNAVYSLPWFLVVGRPSAGKTFAIKESGLGLPVKDDWVKGVGGTYSCDFFFTNDMIFMDTPGRWVRNGADDAAKRYWGALLKLLKKNRGRQPLDGLIVVLSAEDLLGVQVADDDQTDLEEQAANIREIIDLVHDHLGFRFPVYLLVSKSDLTGGFTDFFWGVPAQRRDEIFGWSNANPGDHDVAGMVREGLTSVARRLEEYRTEMLAKFGKTSRNRRLFFFPEELKQMRGRLTEFAEMLFYEDRTRQTPIFRGLYFTSAVQEGSPVSRAISSLASSLGLPGRQLLSPQDGTDQRPFFLKQLLRELMVGDQGLTGRTARHLVNRLRTTALGIFAPAALAVVLLLLSIVALTWNASLYRDIENRVPDIDRELQAAVDRGFNYESMNDRLALTEELRLYHRKLTSVNPFRRFGMRRAKDLSLEVFSLYRDRFEETVLRPTLEKAFESANTRTCADRVDVMYSVAWMRRGEERQDDQGINMSGFDYVWADWRLAPGEETGLTDRLLKQFRHLLVHSPDGEDGKLLAGFDMEIVAEGIEEECPSAGSGSAVSNICMFQRECKNWSGRDLWRCYDLLKATAKWTEQDYERYFDHIRALQRNLDELRKREEPGAGEALTTLQNLDLSTDKMSGCVEDFVELLPELEEFAVNDELVVECREAVKGFKGQPYGKRSEFLATHDAARKESGEALKKKLDAYANECRDATLGPGCRGEIDFELINSVAFNYLREACLKSPPKTQTAKKPRSRAPAKRPVPTVQTGSGKATAPSQPVPKQAASEPETLISADGLFRFTAAEPSRTYTPIGFADRKEGWQEQFIAANDPNVPENQRPQERSKVRGGIRNYGERYVNAWLQYLGGLELSDAPASIPDWLGKLASSPVYVDELQEPANQVVEIKAQAAEEPLNAVTGPLSGLEDLGELAVKAGTYKQHLGTLAQELQSFEENPDKFKQFRDAYEQGDTTNPLRALEQWVGANVVGRFDGRLDDLFQQPLDEARAYVLNAENLIDAQWNRLVENYEKDISGKFPFDPYGEEIVEMPALTGMFGGASGLVHKINTTGGATGTEATAWLERARSLAGALYSKGSDTPRNMKVSMEILPVQPSDPPLGKKFKVVKVKLLYGDEEFSWAEGAEIVRKTIKVPLFGEDAVSQASIKAWVAKKKPVYARNPFGSPWTDGEEVDLLDQDVPWALVRLLRASDGDDSNLVYTVPWTHDKKEKSFTITYALSSTTQLPTLFDLMDKGLTDPPETARD